MTEVDIYLSLQQIVIKHFGLASPQLITQTNIKRDLGLDSLEKVEFMMAIEEFYKIEIPLDDIDEIKTIGELVDCIALHKNGYKNRINRWVGGIEQLTIINSLSGKYVACKYVPCKYVAV